jgi:hypothetical protein
MSVGVICVREVDTANPNETVAVAAERMYQRAVGTLVEFTQIGRLLTRETPRAVIENSVRRYCATRK